MVSEAGDQQRRMPRRARGGSSMWTTSPWCLGGRDDLPILGDRLSRLSWDRRDDPRREVRVPDSWRLWVPEPGRHCRIADLTAREPTVAGRLVDDDSSRRPL